MENLPAYINVVFIITTLLTIFLFYKASGKNNRVLLVITVWLILYGVVALSGFYTVTNHTPTRFMLLILPPVLMLTISIFTKGGKQFLDSLDLKKLTLLHTIRIPVEIVLLWLFTYKAIPGIMTFEGYNWDIISGFTAPIVYYVVFVKGYNRKVLLVWNIICLLLLVNIVVIAVLSGPFPFQKFAFDQPDRALLYFPYIWLPGVIVPMVLVAHVAAIRQLIHYKDKQNII